MKYQKNINYYQQEIIVFYLVECILQTIMDFKICSFINILKYKNTSTEYIISWKSKEIYNYKLIGLNIFFYLTKNSLKENRNTIS